MKMFRAVPKEGFNPAKVYEPQSTRRIPSNLPYLADNILEWLRPENYPSRRFAAYASPTIELALKNASAVGTNPELYVVCEVEFNKPEIKVAHILVEDARYHKDVSKIVRHVISSLGKDFSNMSLKEKSQHAALFFPGVSKEELNEYFASSLNAAKLSQELREISSFWKEASLTPQEHNGELFFEVSDGLSYMLKPIENV